MALQILQQPGAVSFSGDPIIVKAKTSLTGKIFLRINIVCNVSIVIDELQAYTYKEEYACIVGSDGTATLNIGKTVKSALEKYNRQDVNGTSVSQVLHKADFQLVYTEVYLDGVQEVTGSVVTSETYTAITGHLTEFERLISPNEDTESLIGNGRILSRKPSGEFLAKGIDCYIPAIYSQSHTIPYSVTQNGITKDYSDYTGSIYIPKSLKIDTSVLDLGSVSVTAATEAAPDKQIVEETPDMRHFVFLNGFGLLESVTAVSRESLTYNVDSQTYVISKDITYKENTTVQTYSDGAKGVLKMSSGYVNREWADWWINEFITTRCVWMKIDGRFLPVSVVPEEKNQLYDRSKPGLMAVNFNVQYSFTGGTMNLFVK